MWSVNTNHDDVWYQPSFSLNGKRIIKSKQIWAWAGYPMAGLLTQGKMFCPFVGQYTWNRKLVSYKQNFCISRIAWVLIKSHLNEFIQLVTQIGVCVHSVGVLHPCQLVISSLHHSFSKFRNTRFREYPMCLSLQKDNDIIILHLT